MLRKFWKRLSTVFVSPKAIKVYFNVNIIKLCDVGKQRRYEDQWDKAEIPE